MNLLQKLRKLEKELKELKESIDNERKELMLELEKDFYDDIEDDAVEYMMNKARGK